MSTATRATGSRSLTAWSFGPFATVPSYQNRGRGHASVRARRLLRAEARRHIVAASVPAA